MNKSIFEDFIELAKEYRELARCNGYLESFHKAGKYVRCYFADDSDYTSVTIGLHGNQIAMELHQTVQFSGLTINSISSLEELHVEYVNYLAELKERYADRNDDEVKSDKQKAIDGLKERLQVMEGSL